MKILGIIAAMMLIFSVIQAENGYNSKNLTNPMNAKTQSIKPIVKIAEDPKLGRILTDEKGMTLYIFTPDKGSSTCYNRCAEIWPPLYVQAGQLPPSPNLPGKLSITKRTDNTQQVAYDGRPLYYYYEDKKPGDVKGHKMDNKWFVINLDSKQKNY